MSETLKNWWDKVPNWLGVAVMVVGFVSAFAVAWSDNGKQTIAIDALEQSDHQQTGDLQVIKNDIVWIKGSNKRIEDKLDRLK